MRELTLLTPRVNKPTMNGDRDQRALVTLFIRSPRNGLLVLLRATVLRHTGGEQTVGS